MRSFVPFVFVVAGCLGFAACAAGPDEPAGAGPAAEAASMKASAGAAPSEVVAVAQGAIGAWLHAIPKEHLAAYGFADASELDAATLGEPVALHEILGDPEDPSSGDPGAFVEAVPSQHLVPVLVRGEPRAFLRVRTVEGHVLVAGLGDAVDAVAWGIAAARWPADRGYTIRFARREGGSGFLLVDDGAGTHVVPLPSAVRVFHLDTPPIAEVDLEELPSGAPLLARAGAVVGVKHPPVSR